LVQTETGLEKPQDVPSCFNIGFPAFRCPAEGFAEVLPERWIAVYSKAVFLTEETMMFSLFRHAAAQAVRDLIVRAGERVLVERRTLQRISAKIGAKTTQRILGRGASRWIPIVGALEVAGYAYYDTRAVGQTAMDLFSKDINGGAG
jgi:hypothetical protein